LYYRWAGYNRAMTRLVKPLVILMVLAGLAVLFVRSAQSTRAQPYALAAADLDGWTLALDPDGGTTPTRLGLEAPAGLGREIFDQVFSRAMETFLSPAVSHVPVVLTAEFDRALAASMTPQDLLAAARQAGLDGATLTPVCMGWLRDDRPGAARQLYFVLFDSPAIDAFRRALAADAGAALEPLAPALMVAAGESSFASWMPLAVTEADCLAPIEVS
jgi:hypothetical protein